MTVAGDRPFVVFLDQIVIVRSGLRAARASRGVAATASGAERTQRWRRTVHDTGVRRLARDPEVTGCCTTWPVAVVQYCNGRRGEHVAG